MLWGNRQFEGEFPRVDDRLLPRDAAQAAVNCWLDRGHPRPVPVLDRVAGVDRFGALVQSIYRFDDARWFAWDEDVDVVPAPISSDTQKRTIWTGDDYPRHTSTVIMQGGGFVSPGLPISRRLGVPVPDAAPAVALGVLTDEDTGQNAESHVWVFTFLTDLDEEGPPSPASGTLTRKFNVDGTIQPVTITMPTGVTGSYGVNRKRIYRAATGASGVTTYQFVATVNLSADTFVDTVPTADLGSTIVSTFWDPPPEDLTGLIALPNGVLAGYVGRDVYLSESYQPHAWPTDYIQTVDAEIVGLGNFGTNVVVGTKGRPYLISGASPATVSVARMEFEQICAAKRSFAAVDQQGVTFASPEGLVLVGPGGGLFLSRKYYDRADWQALSPAEFRAVYHDGAFLTFSNSKATALNPDIEGIVEIEDAGIKAVFRDTERDKVYVIDSDRYLAEWKSSQAAGDALRTMRWRSRVHVGVTRTFSAAQVIADAYPVTFRLFTEAGIAAIFIKAVASRAPFRLPADLGLHAEWSYEIEATTAVKEVRIGAMMEMLE